MKASSTSFPKAPQLPVEIAQVRMPRGGGALQAVTETFQSTPFTGGGQFSFGLELPEARRLTPALSLSYQAGAGQGTFGLGFQLTVPHISRRLEKRLPTYTDDDEFVLSGSEYLTPALKPSGKDWKTDEEVREVIDEMGQPQQYKICRYRPRTEGQFLKIERWSQADGSQHWRVMTADGLTNIYGRSPAAQIAHPDCPSQVFRWLLELTSDAFGNQIAYHYRAEDNQNVPATIFEQNRTAPVQKYLEKIQYGTWGAGEEVSDARWAFSVVFDYGQYGLSERLDAISDENSLVNLGSLSATSRQPWQSRPDPFSDYRPGFDLRTQRLCRGILVFHHFAELPVEDYLVKAWQLTYDRSSTVSLLSQIQHFGFRRQSDGRYETSSLPPTSLSYSKFSPEEASDFQPLRVEVEPSSETQLVSQSASEPVSHLASQLKATLADQFGLLGYQLIDLYGDGLPGLLHDHQGAPLYWRSLGHGQFEQAASVEPHPIEQQARSLSYQTRGGVQTQVVLKTPERSGFYGLDADERWNRWQSYDGVALERFHPAVEQADVTGNGRPDVLLFETERVKVYPNGGAGGDLNGLTALRSPDLPTLDSAAPNEAVLLADMSGDGLDDRVQVCNGRVTYWPNLGYGRFGNPVTMEQAPRFADLLDPSRLFTADIDGSGTQDLIYIGSDSVQLFFNHSGNRFAAPIAIRLPQRYHPGATLQFADILGNGTTCLVFSSGIKSIQHQFYDFSKGIKPYILNQINSNRGAITRIRYAPSTQFYLQDRRSGRPWVTKLPFPLQVVERIEHVDLIARAKQVVRYAYHHGAYDLREREFAGFGLVEQWDSEAFGQFSETDLSEAEAFDLPPDELHAPPSYQKTWYHNGLAEREDTLSRQFAADYYAGDPQAIQLNDSQIEHPPQETQSLRAAYRALRGRVLRIEVYADDSSSPKAAKADRPYQVQETAYRLRLIQPAAPTKTWSYAPPRSPVPVYLPLERETLRYVYERDASDPRISHRFQLAYDAYGNLLREATLAYARRQPEEPQQAKTQGSYSIQNFVNLNSAEGIYRLGLATEQQQFELLDVDQRQPASDNWQWLAERRPEQSAVDILNHDQPLPKDGERLVGWQRYRYWNPSLTQLLPAGEVHPRGLVARVETAVSAEEAIANLFDDFKSVNLRRKLLSKDGDGGALTTLSRAATGQPYYFDPGVTAHYGSAAQFYQPTRYVDQFGGVTTLKRDPYQLRIVQTEAWLGATERLTKQVELDYVALQPSRIRDVNANLTDYRYDPLGQVRWQSRYGTETAEAGLISQGDEPLSEQPSWGFPTLDAVAQDPAAFLQQATSLTVYDVWAWKKRGQPAAALTITRDRYNRESPTTTEPKPPAQLQIAIEYTDGLGRSLQQKQLAEPGQALQVRGNGSVATVEATRRWRTTGRTVYNNKGAVIRQYEPFYTDSFRYESEQVLTQHGVSTVSHYDPLGRVIRLVYPQGYETRTQYSAWEVEHWDANDTLLTSTYLEEQAADLQRYRARPSSFSREQRDRLNALDKALAHAKTPIRDRLDVWGRVAVILEQERRDGSLLKSRVQLDLRGNPLRQQSPRWAGSDRADIETVYDLRGQPLRQIGRDNGSRWMLRNAGGDLIHQWNGRSVHTATHYDALSRPVGIWTDSVGQPPRQVERIEYGEVIDHNGDLNLRGQVAHRDDGAGRLSYQRYGLDGGWLKCDRRLREAYQQEPDWSATGNRREVLSETYSITRRLDALGRPIRVTYPDGRQVERTYHISGRLKSLALQANGTRQSLIEQASYNARDQRLMIAYGNGTTTTYEYDPLTFELRRLRSQRNRDRQTLQDLHYTYDPVGNVTRLRDLAQNTVFSNNQAVEPRFDYTYDALYRLIESSGREHPGLYNNRPVEELPDYDQLFDLNIDLNNRQALDRYIRRYTYDLAGNLIEMQHRAGRTTFTRRNPVATDSNRLQGTSYDASGNPQVMEHLRSLRWNSGNQLASAEIIQRAGQSSDVEYYAYDAGKQRVRKTSETLVNAQTGATEIADTIYFEDYQIQQIRRNNRVVQVRYGLTLREQELLVAVDFAWPIRRRNDVPEQQLRFQLGDRQGSVALELDSQGRLIAYEEYYAFGGTALVAGRRQREVKRKLYRYSRRERDERTQLYCYGSRYYVPWQSRWLSPDLAGTVDGLNLFIFVRNNPLRYEDDGGFKTRLIPVKVTISGKKKFEYRVKTKTPASSASTATHSPRGQPQTAQGPSKPKNAAPSSASKRQTAAPAAQTRRLARASKKNPIAASLPTSSTGSGNSNAGSNTSNNPSPNGNSSQGNSSRLSVGTGDRDTLILIAIALAIAVTLASQLANATLSKAGQATSNAHNPKLLSPLQKGTLQQQNTNGLADDDSSSDNSDNSSSSESGGTTSSASNRLSSQQTVNAALNSNPILNSEDATETDTLDSAQASDQDSSLERTFDDTEDESSSDNSQASDPSALSSLDSSTSLSSNADHLKRKRSPIA